MIVMHIGMLLLLVALQTQQKAPHIDGFGEWDIILTMDPRTDRKAIALTNSGVIVQLSYKGDPVVITAREPPCRAKPLFISIDNHRAILLGEGGRRHIGRVMSQITNGQKAFLTYYPEPCEESRRLEINLEGFTETLEKARGLSDKEMQTLEEQILAAREEAAQEEAEARLAENPSGELIFAAREGKVVLVIASLDAGADVNIRSESNGYTALIWASARGHAETVRLLLEAGADVNLQANDGQTALMRASDNGRLDIVLLLLDAGADVNAETDRGITALLLAELKNHPEVAEVLKNAGATR